MGAGEDDDVDIGAALRVEHWLRRCADRLDTDLFAGELGLGQLDQLGRAMADDGAVGGEAGGEVVDIGLAHRRLRFRARRSRGFSTFRTPA